MDATLGDLEGRRERPGVKWLHLMGLRDLTLLQDLGAYLGLHPLALEDVVEGRALVKVDDFTDYLFIVSRLVTDPGAYRDEQISLFLGRDYLFSIQESHDDYFGIIRERLQHGSGQIRSQGADYLAYALIDYLVDSWFPLLENFGEKLEELEDRLLSEPDSHLTQELQSLRRKMLRVRRLLWPVREVINNLLDQDSPLIRAHTRIYLRDCYDHVFQVIDLLENFRDMAGGLIEVYLSSLNNRLNQIMKVLAVIATIFIPLNFMASLYGMNFKTDVSPWNMPELSWYFGYPYALGLMATVAAGLVLFFKRKKWL